jgi:hypothetical protein
MMEASPDPLPESPGFRPQPNRRPLIVAVVVWSGAVLGIGLLGFWFNSRVQNASKLRSMIPSQPAHTANHFFVEYDDRIFLRYDELVGPDRYIKASRSEDGEDLSVQFPLRRGWTEPLPVRLPDGSTVERYEVFAAIGRSGLIALYPRPQGGSYDPDRVYGLDIGVSYRGHRVVQLPPDPAGREGRDQDGVHTYQLPDGRRFEITYRGGVPDGPFRAFYADGKPWGEAIYRQGRVIEAWIITRQGRRFDELNDGTAAAAAMEAELKPPELPQRKRAR